jgi:hypothetical protein
MRNSLRRVCFGLLASVGLSPWAWSQTTLTESRTTLEKWVDARQLVSKTRSDWQSDKEMLDQSIKLFERELRSVDEQMAKLDTNSTQVLKEKADAENLLRLSNEGLDRARDFAARFEGEIRKLEPRLPLPLQEILKPLLNRMPSDPAATKMAATERIQVIVGILNELDKFNNAVAVFSEKRKSPQGGEVAAETVYVGLGAAYFVNDVGDVAGTGTPGPGGWEWTFQPDLAPAIREVIRIYRTERPPRFVALPATIR